MGDEALRRRHQGEPFLPGWRCGGSRWLGSGVGLRRGLDDRLGGAGATDAGQVVEHPALVERDIRVEAEVAGRGLVRHGDTESEDVRDHPTVGWSNAGFGGVRSAQIEPLEAGRRMSLLASLFHPKPQLGERYRCAQPGRVRRSKGGLLQGRKSLKLGSDLTEFRPVPLQIPLQRSFTGFLYKKRRSKGRPDKRLGQRRGDREAEGAALEMPCGVTATAGSNPALSAKNRLFSRVCDTFQAILGCVVSLT